MSGLIDLIGYRSGRLFVIQRVHDQRYYRAHWLCKCDCGGKIIVLAYNLKNGHTQSCGCLQKEKLIKRSTTHGHNGVGKESVEYKRWRGIIQRCTNPNSNNYANYGGRGIYVCQRWKKFENFLEDMGESPNGYQIDRIDNNGHYCKENCRWVTIQQQARNKRTNHLVRFNGKVQCVSMWAEEYHIVYDTLLHRLSRGWSIERALTARIVT